MVWNNIIQRSAQINLSPTTSTVNTVYNSSLSTDNVTGYNLQFKPNENMAETVVFTFPINDGDIGQVLTTDGIGNLSWGTVTGGVGSSVPSVIGVTNKMLIVDGTQTVQWFNPAKNIFTSTTGITFINGETNILSASDITTTVNLPQPLDITSSPNFVQVTATKLTGLNTPSNDTDAANKAYVDTVGAGARWTTPVRVVSDSNITSLSGTTTIDGVSLIATNRVLLTAQTLQSQNGIWLIQSGVWTRPNDFLTGTDASRVALFVDEGTSYSQSGWICKNIDLSDTVDTHDLYFVKFSNQTFLAGPGLSKAGSTLNLLYDNDSIVIGSDNNIYSNKLYNAGKTSSLTVSAGGSTTYKMPGSYSTTGTFLKVAASNDGSLEWATFNLEDIADVDTASASTATDGYILQRDATNWKAANILNFTDLKVNGAAISAEVTNTTDIGTSSIKYKDVYITNLYADTSLNIMSGSNSLKFSVATQANTNELEYPTNPTVASNQVLKVNTVVGTKTSLMWDQLSLTDFQDIDTTSVNAATEGFILQRDGTDFKAVNEFKYDNLTVSGNIIPTTTSATDLGSSTKLFKDIYSKTLLAETSISVKNSTNTLTITSNTQTGNSGIVLPTVPASSDNQLLKLSSVVGGVATLSFDLPTALKVSDNGTQSLSFTSDTQTAAKIYKFPAAPTSNSNQLLRVSGVAGDEVSLTFDMHTALSVSDGGTQSLSFTTNTQVAGKSYKFPTVPATAQSQLLKIDSINGDVVDLSWTTVSAGSLAGLSDVDQTSLGASLDGYFFVKESGAWKALEAFSTIKMKDTQTPTPAMIQLKTQNTTAAYTIEYPNTAPTNIRNVSMVYTSSSTPFEWNFSMPVGTILSYGNKNYAPEGFQRCIGTQISRTTYAELFTIIGTSFGPGDGSTTFHLPDFRGAFLRCIDMGIGTDPDRNSRTSFNGGSSGDEIGSFQDHAMTNHSHTTAEEMRSGTAQCDGPDWLQGEVTANTGTQYVNRVSGNPNSNGGNETRPKNFYIMYIIKTT